MSTLGEPNARRDLDATLPQVFDGRYELLDELGCGGFGRVWRARDRRVGRDVAVKVLRLSAAHEAARVTFEQERRALAGIDHPGVVRVIDTGQVDDILYLVTELVPGVSAAEFISTVRMASGGQAPGPLDLEAALPRVGAGSTSLLDAPSYVHAVVRVMVELLRVLEAVHAAGVVHRDLKPANVMLMAGGAPRLLDFGIAAVRDVESGVTSVLVGTLNYLAPEQIMRAAVGRDPRTDVYQAGLVLYEMLCLRPAFPPAAGATTFASICIGRVPRPGSVARWVPREIEDVCLRAMEVALSRRFATVTDFRLELERWLAGEAPRSATRRSLGRAWRDLRTLSRTHRTAAIAIGVAAVVALPTAYFSLQRSPAVTIVTFDRHTGAMTCEVAGRRGVAFGLVPPVGMPLQLLPLRLRDGESPPSWSADVGPGRCAARVLAPPGRDLVSDDYANWRVQPFVLPDGQDPWLATIWGLLAAALEATPAAAALDADMVGRLMRAEGSRGGGPDGFDPNLILQQFTR